LPGANLILQYRNPEFTFAYHYKLRRWSIVPLSNSGRLIFILILLAGSLIQFHWKAALVSLVTLEEIKVVKEFASQSTHIS
jgi:hypothetical protein